MSTDNNSIETLWENERKHGNLADLYNGLEALVNEDVTPEVILSFAHEPALKKFLLDVKGLKAGPRMALVHWWRKKRPTGSSMVIDDDDDDDDDLVIMGDHITGDDVVISDTYVETRGQVGGITAASVGNVVQNDSLPVKKKKGRTNYYKGNHYSASTPYSRVVVAKHYSSTSPSKKKAKKNRGRIICRTMENTGSGTFIGGNNHGPVVAGRGSLYMGRMIGGNIQIPDGSKVTYNKPKLHYKTPSGGTFTCDDISRVDTINGIPKDVYLRSVGLIN